jgi:hypothetical protein
MHISTALTCLAVLPFIALIATGIIRILNR